MIIFENFIKQLENIKFEISNITFACEFMLGIAIVGLWGHFDNILVKNSILEGEFDNIKYHHFFPTSSHPFINLKYN